MAKNKNLLIGLSITLIIIATAVILNNRESPKTSLTPEQNNSNFSGAPKLAFAGSLQNDFGQMTVKEERKYELIISNAGTAPLKIFAPETSCDCTFVQFDINGKLSPEFNMAMHMTRSLRSWSAEILPNDSVKMIATYRPSVMPIKGYVERYVVFGTNDPANPEVQIKLTATVN